MSTSRGYFRFQMNTGGRQRECLMSVPPDEIRFLLRASSVSKGMHEIVSVDQVQILTKASSISEGMRDAHRSS